MPFLVAWKKRSVLPLAKVRFLRLNLDLSSPVVDEAGANVDLELSER